MKYRVGLVGIGVWAKRVHLPALIAHPMIDLVGIWGRNGEKVREVADEHGVRAFADYEELLRAVDIVDLAVVPAVQPELALSAATHGKHLLLEKPIGLSSDRANELAEIVSDQRVASSVFVARLFDPARSNWLKSQVAEVWSHAEAEWLSSAFLPGNPFAGEWRSEAGPLMDVGPHLISQLEFVLGRILSVAMVRKHPGGAMRVGFEHMNGASSEILVDVFSDVPVTEEVIRFTRGSSFRDLRGSMPDYPEAFRAYVDDLLGQIEGRPAADNRVRQGASVSAGARSVSLLEAAEGLL